MEFDAIDWHALWQAEAERGHFNSSLSTKELWDKRAHSFDKRVNRVKSGEALDKDDYLYKMLERIEIRPGWSVLDIGCGPGTLAIPLARKAASVTALDISSEMLKRLKANADNSGLGNIIYLNSSWEDALLGKQVAEHDVVVASRSLAAGNIKAALAYINTIARRAVYLTFPIVHLPLDWEAYRAIGRAARRHPPYIYIYNMLFQMGIRANVEILHSRVVVQFASIEEAIEDLQWRTDAFTPDEKAKLREFLGRRLAVQKDPPVFTHEGRSQWALIWWRQQEKAE